MPLNIFVSSSTTAPLGTSFQDFAQTSASTLAAFTGEPVSLLEAHSGPGQLYSDDVKKKLLQADVLLADVSGRTPNVLFEVGFAQALGKPTVLLGTDPADVPAELYSDKSRFVLIPSSASIGHVTSRVLEAVESVLPSHFETKSTSQPLPTRGVFVSYSHEDKVFLDRIIVHLKPLERDGLFNLWSDTKLRAGDNWRDEIKKAIDNAAVAILLVSADFLASDFITTNELPPLLASAEKGGTRIIPVLVKPSGFLRTPALSRFQGINDPKITLIEMDEARREATYAKLAEVVETHVRAV